MHGEWLNNFGLGFKVVGENNRDIHGTYRSYVSTRYGAGTEVIVCPRLNYIFIELFVKCHERSHGLKYEICESPKPDLHVRYDGIDTHMLGHEFD